MTNVEYIHKRTPHLMMKMIITIWSISFLVSITPSLGMKDDGWLERVLEQKICIVSQDLRYQIFATGLAFYVPLIIVLFLYWKIFQAAKSRIRKHSGMPGCAAGSSGNSGPRGGVIAGSYSGYGHRRKSFSLFARASFAREMKNNGAITPSTKYDEGAASREIRATKSMALRNFLALHSTRHAYARRR